MNVRTIPESNPVVRAAAFTALGGLAGTLSAVGLTGMWPERADELSVVLGLPSLVALAFGAVVAAAFFGWNLFAGVVLPLGRWSLDGENWMALGRMLVWAGAWVLGLSAAVCILWAAGAALAGLSVQTLLVLILLVLVFR